MGVRGKLFARRYGLPDKGRLRVVLTQMITMPDADQTSGRGKAQVAP